MMKTAVGMSLIPILITALSFPKPASCDAANYELQEKHRLD